MRRRVADSVFKKVDPRVSFPKVEEKILAFWKDIDVLRKSLARHADGPVPAVPPGWWQRAKRLSPWLEPAGARTRP